MVWRKLKGKKWIYHPIYNPKKIIQMVRDNGNRGYIYVGRQLYLPQELIGKRVKVYIEIVGD